MKLVQVKIFNTNRCYFVLIEKIKVNNKSKIIEQEYYKKLEHKSDVQYYLTNILNTKEFRKNKIFINYISNDILIETISENNDKKENYLIELNNLYPNFKTKYYILTGELKYNTKNKKKICALVKQDMINEIKSILNLAGKYKLFYGIDPLMLQILVNKNINYFYKKYLVLIQKNYHYFRFYQILNGKIINYLVLDEEDTEFNNIYTNIMKLIDSKVDDVIVDGEYNLYLELVDKLFNVNVILIDYLEKLNHIDERKIRYGKKI